MVEVDHDYEYDNSLFFNFTLKPSGRRKIASLLACRENNRLNSHGTNPKVKNRCIYMCYVCMYASIFPFLSLTVSRVHLTSKSWNFHWIIFRKCQLNN
jgi:uncharacterized membrane protein YhaH (DUF805 family)